MGEIHKIRSPMQSSRENYQASASVIDKFGLISEESLDRLDE